jgi:MIP family channel proteins
MSRQLADEEVLNEWVRPLIVEAIGPFALVFMGAGAIIVTQGADLVAIALAHGLAIGLMVAAAGHISGGAYNPAVTLGLVLGRKLDPIKGVAYVLAQLLGATLAALALYVLFPDESRDAVHLGTPLVSDSIGSGAALGIEIILTFFLMYVIYGTAVDKRAPAGIAPLAIGLTITMDIFAGGPLTGAAMNPARSFGPALVDGTWDDAWVYWVGPALGAAIAALLYAYVLIPPGQGEPEMEPARPPAGQS